jgi:hypothetical protein
VRIPPNFSIQIILINTKSYLRWSNWSTLSDLNLPKQLSLHSLVSSIVQNIDCFENLKKIMDPNLDLLIPALVKKAGDTNQFIAEEAEKTLHR